MAQDNLKLNIQHGRTTIEMLAAPDELVEDIMARLESQAGVLVRHQKLILKGRVLESRATIVEANIKDGAKIMLMTSSGGGSTQGMLAAKEAARAKAAAASKRAQELVSAKKRKEELAKAPAASDKSWQEKAQLWAKTGIISVRDAGLAKLPGSLLAVGAAARTADLGGNALTALPAGLARLTDLMRLRLSHNALTSQGVPWDALAGMQQLSVVALDHNRLETLPAALGALASLQVLSLSHNALTELPAALGQLTALRQLDVKHNQLSSLPEALGSCAALAELDAADNCLSSLPEPLCQLQKLQSLLLDNNRLSGVPADILRGCASLATLSLHGNPITVERLREADGFAEFDARRRAKHTKQLDMRVLHPSAGFDEGADAVAWQSWGAGAAPPKQ